MRDQEAARREMPHHRHHRPGRWHFSLTQMDFVDAHAYWDTPHFPRRQWDMKDWEIKNTAMSDVPTSSALWGLASSRIAGKPFTVTEYNHAAPNEYQSESIPMIASFAAMQDWDAVFLAYSHNPKIRKAEDRILLRHRRQPSKCPRALSACISPGHQSPAVKHAVPQLANSRHRPALT
jgi:hypothetical protein